jgi:hypothetical protein
MCTLPHEGLSGGTKSRVRGGHGLGGLYGMLTSKQKNT